MGNTLGPKRYRPQTTTTDKDLKKSVDKLKQKIKTSQKGHVKTNCHLLNEVQQTLEDVLDKKSQNQHSIIEYDQLEQQLLHLRAVLNEHIYGQSFINQVIINQERDYASKVIAMVIQFSHDLGEDVNSGKLSQLKSQRKYLQGEQSSMLIHNSYELLLLKCFCGALLEGVLLRIKEKEEKLKLNYNDDDDDDGGGRSNMVEDPNMRILMIFEEVLKVFFEEGGYWLIKDWSLSEMTLTRYHRVLRDMKLLLRTDALRRSYEEVLELLQKVKENLLEFDSLRFDGNQSGDGDFGSYYFPSSQYYVSSSSYSDGPPLAGSCIYSYY